MKWTNFNHSTSLEFIEVEGVDIYTLYLTMTFSFSLKYKKIDFNILKIIILLSVNILKYVFYFLVFSF